MGSYRELQEATTANYGATQVSGVHQSPTQPAPYLEDAPDVALVGSVPLEALTAYFKPVVALRTGKTFAFEAIPYCDCEGLTDREELFARAAFEKKVGELGRAVRAVAFNECPSIPVFVGVHPHELKESWLIRPDDPICSHDAEVFLQVAQSTYSPMCLHVLSEVSSRSGISLVLDDFGGSSSSLRQAVELMPAFVKLDAELVREIDRTPRKRTVICAVVQMCMDLGAQVIGKGVETELEARVLLDCGVPYAEGPLMGQETALPSVSKWRGPR
ncbi:MAG TPA: EAL domain-containing protein [Polyangiales bacterium]|jgi:EAL domain-containing protein (putative c-di-GMP-specific phosphodiesterase class I)